MCVDLRPVTQVKGEGKQKLSSTVHMSTTLLFACFSGEVKGAGGGGTVNCNSTVEGLKNGCVSRKQSAIARYTV